MSAASTMRHWWEQCGLARSARGSALRPDITPGASFPDYQLPDHTDTLRRLSVAYTKIATIATDDHHEIQEFRASVGAQWPFLADPGRVVQRDLDIAEYTDPDHDPMIPHTLVLKPGLVVHSIYNGYWFWGRPSVADLWSDLRAVLAEVRQDWDLSTPGLREAWDAGDLSAFHGWSGWSPERVAAARAQTTA